MAPPMFVEGDQESEVDAYDIERPELRLADVERHEARQGSPGGGDSRADAPSGTAQGVREEPARRALALRVAGMRQDLHRARLGWQLGAPFLAIQIDHAGHLRRTKQRNLHEIFETARRRARACSSSTRSTRSAERAHLRNDVMRKIVNQLLNELDDVAESNEGVFVLAATNMPCDIDPALRGRDRSTARLWSCRPTKKRVR